MRLFACALCCAAFAASALAQAVPDIPRFSASKAGGAFPGEWKHVPLASFKNNTDYTLVVDDGAAYMTTAYDIVDDRIVGVRVVSNPEKLASIPVPQSAD